MAAMIPFANFAALASLALLSVTASLGFMMGLFIFFIPALISAILIIYVIGAGTWRTTFASIACGKSLRGINKLGIGLALGMVVGQQISFVGASKLLSNPTVLLLWTVLLLISLTSFFQWVAVGAKTWLPIAARSQSPRIFYRWGLVIGGGILTNLLLGVFITFISLNAQSSAHLITAFNPFISLAIIGLWAYPMSSWFWRKRTVSLPVSEWLFLDSLHKPTIVFQQDLLKPFFALIVGLLGGLVGFIFVLIFSALGSNIVNISIILSICTQVLVAGFVAAWIKQLGSIHGLFSASVAACIMSVGVFFLTPDFNLSDELFLMTGIFNSGGLLAVPTVLIASGVTSLIHDSKVFRVKSTGN
jgi:hypothetical protein